MSWLPFPSILRTWGLFDPFRGHSCPAWVWEQQDGWIGSGSLRAGNIFLMRLETLWFSEGWWGRETGKSAVGQREEREEDVGR